MQCFGQLNNIIDSSGNGSNPYDIKSLVKAVENFLIGCSSIMKAFNQLGSLFLSYFFPVQPPYSCSFHSRQSIFLQFFFVLFLFSCFKFYSIFFIFFNFFQFFIFFNFFSLSQIRNLLIFFFQFTLFPFSSPSSFQSPLLDTSTSHTFHPFSYLTGIKHGKKSLNQLFI